MVAVMGAISSVTNKLFFLTKGGYYNSEDTIDLLKYIHTNHVNKKIAVFFDNSSIHVGKKTKAWMAT
jgi:hypothetical protein